MYSKRRSQSAVKAGMRVERQLVDALLEAATEEVEAFEKHVHELALAEEAAQQ